MRNFLRISFLVILFTTFTSQGFSQAKFGHINSNELLSQMPGRDSAQVELESFARELESTFTALQNEFQTKYTQFLETQETMSQLIRQTKERELISLQERITQFQESAQQEIANKEGELLNPIIEKARKAIEEVAKEGGYTYVFDSGMGILLYSEPSEDIMDKVKAKIGI